MKTALDYARQALRFAERVCDDVDVLRGLCGGRGGDLTNVI